MNDMYSEGSLSTTNKTKQETTTIKIKILNDVDLCIICQGLKDQEIISVVSWE